jgi:acetyl esterase/lipase
MLLTLFLGFASILNSQEPYPPVFDFAKEVVYKEIDGIQLKLWIFNPAGLKPDDKRPAIIFFFGGGWNSGSPGQFEKQCEYLAARGMVAITADYRVKSRHNVLADKCVADAKSAVRWVRKNAPRLGIDPDKIAAGGGSAGGHLAAATALLPKLDEPGEDKAVSCVPNALVLFNPALITAPGATKNAEFEAKMVLSGNRTGVPAVDFSPCHHIKPGLPPAIIFPGLEDPTVPFFTVKLFTEKMKENGNRCELVGYKGEKHGFFNYGKKSNGPFVSTIEKMDAFLVSLGYLDPLPETELY